MRTPRVIGTVAVLAGLLIVAVASIPSTVHSLPLFDKVNELASCGGSEDRRARLL